MTAMAEYFYHMVNAQMLQEELTELINASTPKFFLW